MSVALNGTSLSKIKANSLNLAGTFGFSGTVSGLADETPLVLLSTFTSDGSDATATFASGIDSTYKEYLFVFNNIHPQTDEKDLQVGFRDGGSDYDAVKTTTYFEAIHDEADSSTNLGYQTSLDTAQSTGFQTILRFIGNDNDQSASGIMRLYNPSSTTFVKHFVAMGSSVTGGDYINNHYVAGYCNTTTAIDGVQFKFDSGEIQGGTIDLFGVV
jgi:hypothetical protein